MHIFIFFQKLHVIGDSMNRSNSNEIIHFDLSTLLYIE